MSRTYDQRLIRLLIEGLNEGSLVTKLNYRGWGVILNPLFWQAFYKKKELKCRQGCNFSLYLS